MSEDLSTDKSGGYIVFPRRVRLAGLGAVIIGVFAIGGWATMLQIGIADAKEVSAKASSEVTDVRISVRRIERYLCDECKEKRRKSPEEFDCSDICATSSWKRGKR